jgi:transposase
MGQQQRKYTDDYKTAAVERLYEPGATQSSVSSDLGITGTQLKTWRLEIEAFGSASGPKRRQQADAAELVRLRKENKRLAEEVEILHKASAFFATRAVKPCFSWFADKPLSADGRTSVLSSLPKKLNMRFRCCAGFCRYPLLGHAMPCQATGAGFMAFLPANP